MSEQFIIFLSLILSIIIPPLNGMCPSQCICNKKSVHCSEGTLKNIPHFLNPDIDTLDLANNKILKIESGLTFYTELTLVNISRNTLKSLGRNQFMNQDKVMDLDISSNMVSKIGEGAFNGLENLQTLNLKENEIKKLESGVFTGEKNYSIVSHFLLL